jgi:hypothetical protein
MIGSTSAIYPTHALAPPGQRLLYRRANHTATAGFRIRAGCRAVGSSGWRSRQSILDAGTGLCLDPDGCTPHVSSMYRPPRGNTLHHSSMASNFPDTETIHTERGVRYGCTVSTITASCCRHICRDSHRPGCGYRMRFVPRYCLPI